MDYLFCAFNITRDIKNFVQIWFYLIKLKSEQKVPEQTSDPQINVGLYKDRTEQTSDLQTSDWYKRQTGTNVGLRQTSD